MPYEHSLRSQKEKASNARLAYNEKGDWDGPIQNYDDKVSTGEDNLESSEW